MAAFEKGLQETRDMAVEARTEARNHVASCIEHNRRVEDLLAEGRADRERQHQEGIANAQVLHARISELGNRMTKMALTAMGAVILAAIGALYAIFAKKLGLG